VLPSSSSTIKPCSSTEIDFFSREEVVVWINLVVKMPMELNLEGLSKFSLFLLHGSGRGSDKHDRCSVIEDSVLVKAG
jgi:hypothetical protein